MELAETVVADVVGVGAVAAAGDDGPVCEVPVDPEDSRVV